MKVISRHTERSFGSSFWQRKVLGTNGIIKHCGPDTDTRQSGGPGLLCTYHIQINPNLWCEGYKWIHFEPDNCRWDISMSMRWPDCCTLHTPHPEQIRLDAGGYCRASHWYSPPILDIYTVDIYTLDIYTVDIYTADVYNSGYLHSGYLSNCQDTAELYDLTITGKPILCVLM